MNDTGRPGIDITKNIKHIETLKSSLLVEVARLFEILSAGKADGEDKARCLSDVVISAYALSEKLGLPPQELDRVIADKLKLDALKDENTIYDAGGLYKHINSRNGK